MNSQKGFTLLEVLIALAIAAVSLTAILMAMIEYSKNASYLEEKTFAHWIGLNVIAEVQLGLLDPPNAPNTETGTIQVIGKEWDWSANVRQSDNEYTKQIYVDVFSHIDKQLLSHLEGFLRVKPE